MLGIDQENGLGESRKKNRLKFFSFTFFCSNRFQIKGTLTISGVFYGVAASFFVAINAIYTKKSLNSVENNIWRLTLYNNVNACVIFIPFILVFGEVSEVYNFPKLFDLNFWIAMSISGFLGFSMGYVTSLQIQATSPLTHNVSGTAKAYAQTLMGVMYYHEIKTLLWWISNCFVLIGAALYSHVRNQEMKAKHKQSLETMATEKGTDQNKEQNVPLIAPVPEELFKK